MALPEEVEAAIQHLDFTSAELREPHDTELVDCVPNHQKSHDALRAALLRWKGEPREGAGAPVVWGVMSRLNRVVSTFATESAAADDATFLTNALHIDEDYGPYRVVPLFATPRPAASVEEVADALQYMVTALERHHGDAGCSKFDDGTKIDSDALRRARAVLSRLGAKMGG